MRTDNTDESALKLLARKTNTPSEEVMKVYKREIAALEADAKVKSFISALALRRARERLHPAGTPD
ncbi:MAG: hypothetical protein JWN94_4514 [Betaproteobacteria bacterium]|nr:hypothetical protein [Betaproteobacteria bacterium]